jgi:hypothetical protein
VTDNVKQAREALHAAEARVALLTKQISTEIYQAKDAIEKKHYDNLTALKNLVWDAKSAVRVAETEAATDHAWEGKIVVKTEKIRDRWSGQETGRRVSERGMVVTYRPGVELARNRHHRLNIGTVLVFFLNKNGKPGKIYEALAQPAYRAQWELEVPPVDA